MHVLIWSQPWPTQGGDLFFGLNAFTKTLLEQASALIAQKCKVTIAFPDAFSDHVDRLKGSCDLIPLNTIDVIRVIGSWADPSVGLYVDGQDSAICSRLTTYLADKLPKDVDCVLLWETPSPYLRNLYPDALIVSQMPGAFARAPYPHTITFDTVGLYRQSTMFQHADHIVSSAPIAPALSSFRDTTMRIFNRFPVPFAETLQSEGRQFSLLPLQISAHYAFKADTGFYSQAEFCMKALTEMDPSKTVMVTQYVSNMYRDMVMTQEFTEFLVKKHPNLVFDPETGSIPSVSQHLLQSASEVAVATSGLALQAMIWHTPLKVIGETHLAPFDQSKVSQDIQRDRILSFALMRNQPLASKLLDGKFLVSLLEELAGRRARPIEDRFPSFTDIDPHYDEILLSSFREKIVERDYARAGLASATPSKASQFADLLKTQSPQLVSFDLFDTLVIRGFEAPADLYRLLELEVDRRRLEPIFDFAAKRLAAELAARTEAQGEEISLQDIYDQFALALGVPASSLAPYLEAEIEIEVRACRVRPIGQRMFQAAKAANIPVIVTSDMYLPRHCIDSILDRTGYDPDQIYLSSEIGMTKKSGSLFDYIAAERSISPVRMVHVGDNINTDVRPAESRKITAFHVPKSSDYISKHPQLLAAFGRRVPMTGLGRSVTAGAIAHKLFDDPKKATFESVSRGDPWLLGYTVVGPLVAAMATWIRRSSIEMELETLHFLSREGKILKDAFDRVASVAPTRAKSNYLFGSRRAIRVAQLSSFEDIIELANQTIDNTASLSSLLTGRFGLESSAITSDDLAETGYKNLQAVIGRSAAEKAKLRQLLKRLEPKILSIAHSEGTIYREYLKASGLYSDERFAVVDVGWHANMQGSLGQMLGKPITGLYFASLEASTRWKRAGHTIRAFMGEDVIATDRDPILSNRLMLENILCDVTPTIERVRQSSSGSFEPVYVGETSPDRLKLIGAIQRGALSFVDDICRTLGPNIAEVNFGPDIATALMADFLSSPSADDAALFLGAQLEDAFSGAATRHFISPTKDVSASYWKAGYAAVKARTKTAPSAATPVVAKAVSRAKMEILPIKREPSGLQKSLMPIVRPLVAKIGNEKDLRKFNADPEGFFADLRNPWYRGVGAVLFPPRK
ncbi:hypothetical protein ASG25_13515 [Rhizobium sp. Leaf384]|uniref:HAD family hydrolase n=1 Tax=unclassified Rhizobium TaxID=2613769 RepID=UPI000712456B|nr:MULTISPECIES: HAD family hydrolase [unclassified Rhizobium]KQS77619.1 hypothetical protein ASG25_13515 [Rhizobium sp. Leaf384]KQS83739.1 hypothetical protein ASG58_21950 [Rhizobium sp. Leaf383]